MAQLLRIRDVCARTTLSQGTIYKRIREGTFPRGKRLGGQAVAWLESDVDEWIGQQLEADPDDWLTPDRKAKMESARLHVVKTS